MDTLYKWSALNTDLLGEYLGVALQNLHKVMPWMDIHLIGALDMKTQVDIFIKFCA